MAEDGDHPVFNPSIPRNFRVDLNQLPSKVVFRTARQKVKSTDHFWGAIPAVESNRLACCPTLWRARFFGLTQ